MNVSQGPKSTQEFYCCHK